MNFNHYKKKDQGPPNQFIQFFILKKCDHQNDDCNSITKFLTIWTFFCNWILFAIWTRTQVWFVNTIPQKIVVIGFLVIIGVTNLHLQKSHYFDLGLNRHDANLCSRQN